MNGEGSLRSKISGDVHRRVRFDESLRFELKVIGGERPTGLCGSGIIDFLAEGLRCGLINAMGRFDRDMLRAAEVPQRMLRRVGVHRGAGE